MQCLNSVLSRNFGLGEAVRYASTKHSRGVWGHPPPENEFYIARDAMQRANLFKILGCTNKHLSIILLCFECFFEGPDEVKQTRLLQVYKLH